MTSCPGHPIQYQRLPYIDEVFIRHTWRYSFFTFYSTVCYYSMRTGVLRVLQYKSSTYHIYHVHRVNVILMSKEYEYIDSREIRDRTQYPLDTTTVVLAVVGISYCMHVTYCIHYTLVSSSSPNKAWQLKPRVISLYNHADPSTVCAEDKSAPRLW